MNCVHLSLVYTACLSLKWFRRASLAVLSSCVPERWKNVRLPVPLPCRALIASLHPAQCHSMLPVRIQLHCSLLHKVKYNSGKRHLAFTTIWTMLHATVRMECAARHHIIHVDDAYAPKGQNAASGIGGAWGAYMEGITGIGGMNTLGVPATRSVRFALTAEEEEADWWPRLARTPWKLHRKVRRIVIRFLSFFDSVGNFLHPMVEVCSWSEAQYRMPRLWVKRVLEEMGNLLNILLIVAINEYAFRVNQSALRTDWRLCTYDIKQLGCSHKLTTAHMKRVDDWAVGDCRRLGYLWQSTSLLFTIDDDLLRVKTNDDFAMCDDRWRLCCVWRLLTTLLCVTIVDDSDVCICFWVCYAWLLTTWLLKIVDARRDYWRLDYSQSLTLCVTVDDLHICNEDWDHSILISCWGSAIWLCERSGI